MLIILRTALCSFSCIDERHRDCQEGRLAKCGVLREGRGSARNTCAVAGNLS